MMANLEEEPDPNTMRPLKRKLNDISGGKSDHVIRVKKKRKPSNRVPAEEKNLDLGLGLNTAIGRLDSQLLADLIAQKVKKAYPDLSIVELEELRLPSNAIRDTSEWQQDRSLQQLPLFLEYFSFGKSKLISAASKKGAPHTLVVTSAGLRAANITRTLRVFETPKAVVSKLFAKHIKLKEALEHVRKTRMGIGVGTPMRIIDLLNAGALLSDKLERIIIDCSHIDQKKRGILDMQETLGPLLKLLIRQGFKERYSGSPSKLDLTFF